MASGYLDIQIEGQRRADEPNDRERQTDSVGLVLAEGTATTGWSLGMES